MDVTTLTKIAADLGIKLTNAEEGTEMYTAWADRVEQAEGYDLDLNHARKSRGPEAEYARGSVAKRDSAIAEANRYAI